MGTRSGLPGRALLLLATTSLLLTAAPAIADLPDELFAGEVTGLACDDDEQRGSCTGFLAGSDGTALDVDLALPATGSYPLLVVVHGWGGNKGGSGASASYPGDQALTDRGYAVMRYSTRGFGKSWGQTHLASVNVEIADLQALVSQIVDDPRFAVLPDRIGVTGASYGGGHSWLAATRPAWRSPAGTPIRIAAVAPVVPWTDLVSSLLPNGRPTRSTEVVGTPKLSYISGLFAGGARQDPERPYPNYIPLLPELYARVLAGEPFEAGQVRDPEIEAGLRELTVLRSPAWQRAWLRTVATDPTARVPVFNVQGWTDDLFPAQEALRMYRLLRAADPSYPIALYFGDVGHPRARNKAAEMEMVLGRMLVWFDHWLLGRGPTPAFDVTSATTTPGTEFDPSQVVTAGAFAGLSNKRLRLTVEGPIEVVNQPGQFGGIPADPIVQSYAAALTDPMGPHAVEADRYTGNGWVAATMRAPAWYVGLGTVLFTGTIAGTDAQYDVRVWDRSPQGAVHLVDRGTFKYLGPPGEVSIRIPLNGNSWRFERGHEVIVEVTAADWPYLRPNNLPATTVIDELRVELPTRRV